MEEKFGSKLGVIVAAAGAAIGLGNIWRFPYQLGAGGGGAFLLVYIACLIFIGWPLLLAELYIGRTGGGSAASSTRHFIPGRNMAWVGHLAILADVLIFSYYIVVSGWTFCYVWRSLTGGFAGLTSAQLETSFVTLSSGSWQPWLWMVAFLLITLAIILLGVQKGIEKSGKFLMPVLFLVVVALAVRGVYMACTNSAAAEGLSFILRPDFSRLTPETCLGALGQCFFSLSIGFGGMLTYGSYIKKDENLTGITFQVLILDTLVAILAAMAIFPAAYYAGIQPDAGCDLVYITLPSVFNGMPGGQIMSALFFLLLGLAALTSAISLAEVPVAFLVDQFHFSRKNATLILGLVGLGLGTVCCLSFGPLSDWTIMGKTAFDAFDYITSNYMLPIGGFLMAIMVGWMAKRQSLNDNLNPEARYNQAMFITFFRYMLRYMAPWAILVVFVNQLVGFSWLTMTHVLVFMTILFVILGIKHRSVLNWLRTKKRK